MYYIKCIRQITFFKGKESDHFVRVQNEGIIDYFVHMKDGFCLGSFDEKNKKDLVKIEKPEDFTVAIFLDIFRGLHLFTKINSKKSFDIYTNPYSSYREGVNFVVKNRFILVEYKNEN